MVFARFRSRSGNRGADPRAAERDFERLDRFVESTRSAIYIRPEDHLLLIRPDKTLSLNDSAVAILGALLPMGQV